MKQIRYRRLVIPANTQPLNNAAYNLVFDKGTEEVSIMFTRPATGSYNVYLVGKSQYSVARDFVNQFGATALSSSQMHTIKAPTLFHKSIVWNMYIDPPQAFDVHVEYISLIDTDSYLYD